MSDPARGRAPRACRVAHVPDYADSYQQHLREALQCRGVTAELAPRRQRLGVDVTLLAAALWPHRVDVLHIHWQHPFLLGRSPVGTVVRSLWTLLQLVVLRLIGIRLVWTVHNLVNHDQRHARLETLACRFLGRIVHDLVVHCPVAATLARDTYRLSPRARIHCLPHPGYKSKPFTGEERARARQQLGIGTSEFLFLHFGLLREYKGVGELLHAFGQLPCPDARLMVVGNAKSNAVRANLLAAAANDPRIHVELRYIPDGEVRPYFAAADVLVLPYRNILTSGGIATGASFGVPIVAPRLGCIPEQLPHEWPFLYQPLSADGLHGRLTAALAMPQSDLAALGRAGADFAMRWTWQESAAALVRIYRGDRHAHAGDLAYPDGGDHGV